MHENAMMIIYDGVIIAIGINVNDGDMMVEPCGTITIATK